MGGKLTPRLQAAWLSLLVATVWGPLTPRPASAQPEPSRAAEPLEPETRFDSDGTAHVSHLTVPPSSFSSDQAKSALARAHRGPPAPPMTADIKVLRSYFGRYNDALAAHMKEIYPVDITTETIAGVRVEIVRPKGGLSTENAHRILINLHGGGFLWGEGSGEEIESTPIASRGRITVVTIAYRQAPEHHFPAASEDVATVYRALLARHKPSQIGIYGCSAGGILTAQAVAWFDKVGLPQPGAVGTFCGSAAPLSGDTLYAMQPLGGDRLPDQMSWPYFAGADPHDPLVFPTNSSALLAKFPPTLLLAGSRDFALSSIFYTQQRLTEAGVDVELHVWDGLWHAFFINPDLPESREAYDVIVKFFDRHLAR